MDSKITRVDWLAIYPRVQVTTWTDCGPSLYNRRIRKDRYFTDQHKLDTYLNDVTHNKEVVKVEVFTCRQLQGVYLKPENKYG